MQKSKIVDIKLFEELSSHLQQVHSLNPLAADIFTYILFDISNEGVTFKEFITFFEVSKSSVSTSINLLLQAQLIEFTHKIGSRKRYFKLNRKNYIKSRLNHVFTFINKEKELSERFLEHVKENTSEEIRIERSNIYIKHLEKVAIEIESTIQQLKELDKH